MRRAIVVLIVALLFVVVGPLITSPRGKSAGTAFVYEPPEGFKHPTEKVKGAEGAEVWVFEEGSTTGPFNNPARNPNPPTIVVTTTAKEMSVEERDLAKLVEDMPSAFEGCTWVHRRHELRTRADGARVGMIEGDCDKEVDLTAFGLPSKTIKQRKLQLMFPEDEGTAIVTASYLTEHASRWEPLLEATIGKAKGVATRTPAPPQWMYGAWGLAGVVIAWLATALVSRQKPAAPASVRARKEEERDEKAEA
ncbi:MAG: hypothetical protein U0270_42160 [Labilithrix sp.]